MTAHKPPLISVQEALEICLSYAHAGEDEFVPLAQAHKRTLAAPAIAQHAQPPFSSSAMDGYACKKEDVRLGHRLEVVGTSAAGHPWTGTLEHGQTTRIFTGAPIPSGADCVVIQEHVSAQGHEITLTDLSDQKTNIRHAGCDFQRGFKLTAPRRLSAYDLALLASMNIPTLTCSKRPKIALISTGDELVMPGTPLKDGQIVASNHFALAPLIEEAGAQSLMVPIVRDHIDGLKEAFQTAQDWGADMIVSIGGASVGDHDLLAQFVQSIGVQLGFHKIAMRPGKPLICGASQAFTYLGLPGNPVSAIVCAKLFLLPMIRKMLKETDISAPFYHAKLTHNLPANGPRTHFMRAHMSEEQGQRIVTSFENQDSSLLTTLSQANCLIERSPYEAPKQHGDSVTLRLL